MNESIANKINDILDMWDPIGINQLEKGVYYGEYASYVPRVMVVYKSGKSVFDYLVQLYTDLIDYPNEEGLESTKKTSEDIIKLFEDVSPSSSVKSAT